MPQPAPRPSDRLRNEWTVFALVVGSLVLLNVISVRNFFRWDLTRSHAYSLAKISKQYMRDLKDPITVKAFFTKNLPAPYNSNARYLRDLLEDYRAYSRGKFNYQFIDPADDPSLEQEARSLGVYQIQLTAIEKDKFEQKNGYMGLALIYRDRREIIPLIQDTQGLEYQLTSMIKKLVQGKTKVVGISQGYGEPGLYNELENFRQLLAKNYEVVPVDLSRESIPDRVDALLLAGPTETLPEDKLYRLDHFLRAGRNLAVMAQMVKTDARQSMQGHNVNSGIARLLAAWGVQAHPDLIYDLQCQRIAVSQRGPGFIMQNIVPYPPFVLVTALNPDSLINQNLESYSLPFVSAVTLEESVLKSHNLAGRVLAQSSPRAWEQKDFYMLSPQFIRPPDEAQLRQFDLAVDVSGKFPSAFSPDRLPVPAEAGETLPPFAAEAKPARLVVIGGVDFLTNEFINEQRNDQGTRFALNLVDWVAQDPALIEIRNKGLSAPPLTQVSEAHRQVVKYFNLIGLPLLVVAAGLLMWRRLEGRRSAITALFRA